MTVSPDTCKMFGMEQETMSELNLPVVIEVDSPSPEDMPEKVQQILCLLACGFSQASVAHLLKCERQTVSDYITRYDPKHSFTLSVAERKRFLARLWEAKAGEALLHITPEKMALSKVGTLAGLAHKATLLMDKMTKDDPPERDPAKLIGQLSPVLRETSIETALEPTAVGT